jgi:hypothetical protein
LDGGVTPKRANTPDLSSYHSLTSLRATAWERWAKSIAERSLGTEKERGLASTPRCKSVAVDDSARNEDEHLLEDDHMARVGGVFFITPYRAAGI